MSSQSTGASEGRPLTVAQFPDFTDGNPYQRNLVEALRDDGDEVVLGGSEGYLPLLRTAYREGVDVVHLHWLNVYLYGASGLGTAVTTLLTAFQLVVLRLAGVPVVWTVHNVYTHDAPNPRLERWFRRWFARFVCRRIVVHCPAAEDAVVDAYRLPDRARDRVVVVVPHGHFADNYPQTATREAARDRLSLPDDATVFLAFGMVRPYKQVPALVETFRAVAGPDDRLVVAGNPNRDWLERAVRERADGDPRVRLDLRFVPDDEVGDYFAAADAVVLPYRDILTSGSAVLAMSFGRAVVAPRIGCLPWQVGDGGVLYDPDGADADGTDAIATGGETGTGDVPLGGLAGAISEARDRDLDAMGARNRQRVLALDWEGIAERTRAVYAAARR